MSATHKTCTRCNGTGHIPGYNFIDSGRCWGCLGAGTRTAQSAAKPFATIKTVRIERANSKGGPIDITLGERDGVYRVVILADDINDAEVFATIEDAKAHANAIYKAHKEHS